MNTIRTYECANYTSYQPLPRSTKEDEISYFHKMKNERELTEEMDSWFPKPVKQR